MKRAILSLMMMALLSSCETEEEIKMNDRLLIIHLMQHISEEQKYNNESAVWFINNTPLDSMNKAHIRWIGDVNDSLGLVYDSLKLELKKY